MEQEAQSPEAGILDTEQLETFLMLGYEDYANLLGDVVTEVPSYIATIHSSILSRDSGIYSAAIHSFRGMISYFGCINLTEKLAFLEKNALPEASFASDIQAELLKLWEKSLAAIRQWESDSDFHPGSPPQ